MLSTYVKVESEFWENKIGGIEVQNFELDSYSRMLNCASMMLSFKYLGLWVGRNYSRNTFWQHVINKIILKISTNF